MDEPIVRVSIQAKPFLNPGTSLVICIGHLCTINMNPQEDSDHDKCRLGKGVFLMSINNPWYKQNNQNIFNPPICKIPGGDKEINPGKGK